MSDPDSRFTEDVIDELLDQLRDGNSLRQICADKRMPDRTTIWRWAEGSDDLATAIVRAREQGYHARAERAVEEAKTAKDAALGRLAFDAERWHLSKLAPAFAEKVKHVGGDEGDEPIRTQSTLITAGLTDEQLRALASIRVSTD